MQARSSLLILCACLARLAVEASPGLIMVTTDPPSPILSGQRFRLTLRMTGYSDGTEIDGFRFRVAFPSQIFSFVPGSESTGAESGPDQQWLTKPNQESAAQGSQLSLTTEATAEGYVDFQLRDVGAGPTERGCVAAQGFLLSFELSTHGEGTGLIHPTPYPSEQGVLYDTKNVAAGVPSFGGAFMEVRANTLLQIVRTPTNVVVSWPTNLQDYSLQQKAVLDPALAWTNVAATVVVRGDRYQSSFPLGPGNAFWRLQGP